MEKIKLKEYLIAGGNSTLLAWNCPNEEKANLSKHYLGEVEQVGFISVKRGGTALEMMGRELCINATIALASLLEKSGRLLTSGLCKPLRFSNKDGITSLELPLVYRKKSNFVLFPGIGFKYTEKISQPTKEYLRKLCNTYGLPAFGIAIYKNGVLTPYVYVKETNSLFKETACGSGSITATIFTGDRNIVQPSGETISVELTKSSIVVSAKVTEVEV